MKRWTCIALLSLVAIGCGDDSPGDDDAECTTASECDDGDACTEDACISRECSNAPVDVDDDDACTTDACDPATGVSHTPVDVDDDDACTTDACDPVTGVSHTPLAAIDDDDACTTDACDAATGDVTHTPVDIDDEVACTIDACDPATGDITHTTDDTACDDVDGASCTEPVCDAVQGCLEQADNAACADGQACTTADVCDPDAVGADETTGCAYTADHAACDDTVGCTDDVCTPFTGCTSTEEDDNCDPGQTCDATLDCVGGTGDIAEAVITEFVALGEAGNAGELIEVYNPGVVDGDLGGGTITNGAAAVATIRPASNPTGTGPVMIPAGGYAYGVPNPADPADIPPGAAFVYGDPGTTFEIADTGDSLVLRNAAAATLDVVDFTGNFHTNLDVPFDAPNAFPGVVGVSTQLDPTRLNTTDNGDGANWCTTFRLFDTAGAANQSCAPTAVVINELVYDGAIGADTADARRTFIELSGPGGARVADLRIRFVETDGATAGNLDGPNHLIGDLLANARLRPDGLFVIADNTGGDSLIVPATRRDAQAAFDPENGSQAAQLLLDIGGALSYVDALAYAGTDQLDVLVDSTDALPLVETSAAIDANQGVSLARNLVSEDTGANAVDFVADPSPSPGLVNQPVDTTIASLSIDEGLATVTTTGVVITGTDLGFSATITFAGVAATGCNFNGTPTSVTCNVPTGTVGRGDVVYTNTADRGGDSFTLNDGWTFTGALNETDTADEADYCILQFPATITVAAATATETIYGRIFEAGVTEAAGADGSVLAEVGYGPAATSPATTAGWRFSPATYNVQVGNDDEYQGTLTVPTAGSFSYAFRFSRDGGLNHTYCDLDGAGSNGGLVLDTAQLGALTVN